MAGLLYGASYDSTTHTVSLTDKAGNVIYSFVVDITPPQIVDDPTKPLYLRSMANGSTVFMDGVSTYVDDSTFEKSTDGTTWTAWALGSANGITLNRGQGVYIRAKVARTVFPTSGVPVPCYIGMTGEIEAYHNVYSILTPNFSSITDLTTVGGSCLQALFSPNTTSDTSTARNTALIKAPLLPATTLSQHCYNSMFLFCTALHTPPQLPATTLAASCYNNMFNQSGLTTAPVLPATTAMSQCYQRMFKGCALTNPPDLPATTLSSSCYKSMFENCTNITKAPLLPATTLSQNGYQSMFKGCSNLNEVHIAANNISAYNALSSWLDGVAATGDFYAAYGVSYTVDSASGIPQGWTLHREIVESPNLPLCFKATQNNSSIELQRNGTITESYEYSLDGVTWSTITGIISLNDGDVAFVRTAADRATNQTSSNYIWFQINGEVEAYNNLNSLLKKTNFSTVTDLTAASGNYAFYRLFKGPGAIGENYINYALVKAPLLPATTLSTACYRNMFLDCKNLVKAPDLPATTLTSQCYSYMYGGCSLLDEVRIHATDISATGCLQAWLWDVAASGDFYCVDGVQYPVDNIAGIPQGWTRRSIS